MKHRQDQQRIGGHAVLELHGERVVEQIAPPRLLEPQPRRRRNEGAVDLGPGVVHPARPQARDQRAEIKLDESQGQQSHAGDLQPHRDSRAADARLIRRSVQTIEAKMIRASIRCVASRYCDTSVRCGQARSDHPPADRALQRAKGEDHPQPPLQLSAKRAAPQEVQERQQIDRADHAPEQPVAPFPPEDGLELRKAHAGVEFAVLRDRLVALERLRPLRLVERRQRAGNRLPLDDRQSGFRQPRGAADQHHDRDQRGDRDQPPSDGGGMRSLLCGTTGHKARLALARASRRA